MTEELWPGYKVSTAAYVNSLLRPEIIRDLELKKYGFEMLPRSPSSFTPFPDGRYLMMGPDKAMTHREIAKFSAKDADAYPKYEDMLTRVADSLEFLTALRTQNVKLLCDLFHMNIEEADLGAALRRAGAKVGHVHFADSNRQAIGLGHTDMQPDCPG